MDSLYISRPVLNAQVFHDLAVSMKFEYVLPPEEMHTTVAYSTEPVDWDKDVFQPLTGTMKVTGGIRRLIRLDGGAVVLAYESRELADRWGQLILAGASWDHPNFTPHVTLAYDTRSSLAGRVVPSHPIELGGEERSSLYTGLEYGS